MAALPGMGKLVELAQVGVMGVAMEPVAVGEVQVAPLEALAGLEVHQEVEVLVVAVLMILVPLVAQEARAVMAQSESIVGR